MKEGIPHMEKILEEFLELIKINSGTKNERAMADALTGKLIEIGCTVTEDDVGTKIGGNAGNLYAVLPGTLAGSILLTAHMDRVPNGENIVPVISGDVISSDGTTILAADDIAGVCAILDGLRRVKDIPHCTVEILFTVSEEVGLGGSRNLDYSMLQSKNAYVFDSSGRVGRIINGAPSKADITIHVNGKTAHAGNEPEKGIDAAYIAAKLLAAIPVGRLDSDSVSNFPILRTNATATNVVCNHATIIGEARSKKHEKLEQYLKDLKTAALNLATETGATIDVETYMDVYAFHVPENYPVIQKAVQAMHSLDIQAKIEAGGGCMDANWFNKYGINSIGLATGYMANHTNHEHLYAHDLQVSGQLAAMLIKSYSE